MGPLPRFPRCKIFDEPGEAIYVQRIESQYLCAPHDHEFIEIVLTVSGRAEQATAQRHIPISPGTLTVLRPGHWHSYRRCRKLSIYNCCFGAELLRSELAWLINNPTLTWLLWGTADSIAASGPCAFQLESKSRQRLQTLLEGFEGIRDSSYDVRISWLGLFLTTLAEDLRGRGGASGEGSRLHVAVSQAIRRMDSDLARPWTISELAGESGCSREYLVRLFRATMGLPPHAYLNRCRAERAAGLLLRSELSMKEIGAQVGWPEPCHFARRFKSEFGVAATVYREQRRARGQNNYLSVPPKTALLPNSSSMRRS